MKELLMHSNNKENSNIDYVQAFTLYNCISMVSETWEIIPKSNLQNGWRNLLINCENKDAHTDSNLQEANRIIAAKESPATINELEIVMKIFIVRK